MTANPWDKFFWNDWENDPALRLCSLAAQGLWMRCLCIAAKADPKGYVSVAGRPLTPSDLASLVGKPEHEVETLLSELATNGVFSRDRKSRIYSRRMVRDVKKAKTARENGKFGGNPNLTKQTEISSSDNPPDNPEVKTHKPEARIHKPERKKNYAFEGRVVRVTQADFDRWRRSYSKIPDLTAELQAADDYYAPRDVRGRDLFFAVSAWLKRANEAAVTRKKEASRGEDWW